MLGPDEYLNHVQRVKQAVRIPVIESLIDMSPGGWLSYARLIEQPARTRWSSTSTTLPLTLRRAAARSSARPSRWFTR